MDPSNSHQQQSAAATGQQQQQQPQPPTPVQSMKAEAPMHEVASLQAYQPPGFYGHPIDTSHYCRNPCDGTVLRDAKDTPITVAKMLATKPLRSEISTRPGPGGKKMAYVGGEQVTRGLNEVFGFDGWNLTVLEVKREHQEKNKDKYTVCYAAHVKVSVRHAGAFREDWGTCEASDRNFAKAIDTALKGSITDALKRAARHFGDKLGNDVGNLNSAPKSLQQALDHFDIHEANTKFGFKNKNNAAAAPPRNAQASAPPQGKPMVSTNTANNAHHPSNNNKVVPPPNVHAQKQNITTHQANNAMQKVVPPPSRPVVQQHANSYSASTTASTPIARPTSSYGRPSNNNNHSTNKPPIQVAPAVTTTAPAVAATNTVDNGRRVSLEQPTTGGGNVNPANPYQQGGQSHVATAAVAPQMQQNGATHQVPSTQQQQLQHKRPPLHSLPPNDSYATQTAASQQQQQPAKRPASMMANPYSQQNTYPNKNGGAGRHSF